MRLNWVSMNHKKFHQKYKKFRLNDKIHYKPMSSLSAGWSTTQAQLLHVSLACFGQILSLHIWHLVLTFVKLSLSLRVFFSLRQVMHLFFSSRLSGCTCRNSVSSDCKFWGIRLLQYCTFDKTSEFRPAKGRHWMPMFTRCIPIVSHIVVLFWKLGFLMMMLCLSEIKGKVKWTMSGQWSSSSTGGGCLQFPSSQLVVHWCVVAGTGNSQP